MEAAGVTVDDYASPDSCIEDGIYYDTAAGGWRYHLWPENLQAIDLYLRVRTQWRTGPMGAVGLDYNVVYRELDRAQLPPDEFDTLFDDIREIEHAVLSLK